MWILAFISWMLFELGTPNTKEAGIARSKAYIDKIIQNNKRRGLMYWVNVYYIKLLGFDLRVVFVISLMLLFCDVIAFAFLNDYR